MGEKIAVASRDNLKFNAYLARPAAGAGPGVVIVPEIFGVNDHIRSVCDRFAEEGYIAAAPDIFWRVEPNVELGYGAEDLTRARALRARCDVELATADIAALVNHLRAIAGATGKVGVVGFCFGGRLAFRTAASTDVDAAVCYYGGGIEQELAMAASIRCPIMFHWGANDASISQSARESVRRAMAGHEHCESYVYGDAGHGFNCDRRPSFNRFAARLAFSRTLGMLRSTMGPRYDLSALWEAHTACEFAERDADATMRTMVAEPYVNHVPTMIGGIGHDELHRFYRDVFIAQMPPDAKLVPVSRTIGADRLVDEFIVCFTHDRVVDFMAPGIPPTGKYVEVPHVAVVEFRGDKLAHEHIYWDHASLLKQLGLLDPKLPVLGAEGARKLIDESLPENALLPNWKRARS